MAAEYSALLAQTWKRAAASEAHSIDGRPARADPDPVIGDVLSHRGLGRDLRAQVSGAEAAPEGAAAPTAGRRVCAAPPTRLLLLRSQRW